jgi:V/A-type H+-transporting ATPase subunit D
MAQAKLTKNELKHQRDALKMYQRYLPTLQLKKQQLQTVIRQVEHQAQQKAEARRQVYQALSGWIAVFGEADAGTTGQTGAEEAVGTEDAAEPAGSVHGVTEPAIVLSGLVRIRSVERSVGNIAGVDIPVFERIEFEPVVYDPFVMPPWVDAAVRALTELARFDAEIMVLEEQVRLLSAELRITTQRVNLFEKVKIPETKENIRRIQIYIGDQQTAAVVRGKIAKNKVQRMTGE